MPRGGFRPGAGRPRKHPKRTQKRRKKPEVVAQVEQKPASQEPVGTDEPLEVMLKIMRDPNADPDLRARMAIAAAPYCHPKMGEQGKKDQKNEAAKRVASKFTASTPPPPRKH
jgi:phage terminase small subunit